MKKMTSLILCLIMIFTVSACANTQEIDNTETSETYSANLSELENNEIEKLIPNDLSHLQKIIYKDNMQAFYAYSKDENLYPVIILDVIKEKQAKNLNKVFLVIRHTDFSFDGVKFKAESGSVIPYRYDIDNEGNIIKKWVAEDGSYFSKSILKMAEYNKSIADGLIDACDYDDTIYQKEINELSRIALKLGLNKSDFSFELKNIPTYKENVMYIEENILDGNVCVISKKDYDELQEERKEIVASDKAGKHWVYRKCIWWNKDTGICVEKLLDYTN